MRNDTCVVAFDLDGTLFSSEAILRPAYKDSLEDHEARTSRRTPVPTTEEILACVGMPSEKIFDRLFPDMSLEDRRTVGQGILAGLCTRIRAREGRLYDGVLPMLSVLRERGYKLVLVSNCRRAYMESILGTYDLMRFFAQAHCNEDDPALGKKGLLKNATDGSRGVMVGDRKSDGEAARHAGVPWIGCHYGHTIETDSDELAAAAVVVHSVEEIPAAVERVLGDL